MEKPVQLSTWEKGVIAHIKKNADTPRLFVCSLAHVARSGMQREIKFGINYKGEFADITYLVAKYYGSKIGKNGGVKVRGCGMDMIFHALNNFFSALGFESPYKCSAVQNYKLF